MVRKLSLFAAVCLCIALARFVPAAPLSAPTVTSTTRAIPLPNTSQAASEPAIHLMNGDEFTAFLGRLDSGVIDWKAQVKRVDVRLLGLDPHEFEQTERSQTLCVQALDDTREDLQKLAQKQTLKLDFLLLVDLNDLARSLDEFNRDLADPPSLNTNDIRRSLGYARQLLNVETDLASQTVRFQHHVLAYASLVDATLDQSAEETAPQQPTR